MCAIRRKTRHLRGQTLRSCHSCKPTPSEIRFIPENNQRKSDQSVLHIHTYFQEKHFDTPRLARNTICYECNVGDNELIIHVSSFANNEQLLEATKMYNCTLTIAEQKGVI